MFFIFQCHSNSHCIPGRWQCDGEGDCADGSDEADCANVTAKPPPAMFHLTCGPQEFTCATGHCIHAAWKCDGDPDCPDHSDETNCMNPLALYSHSNSIQTDSMNALFDYRHGELQCDDPVPVCESPSVHSEIVAMQWKHGLRRWIG